MTKNLATLLLGVLLGVGGAYVVLHHRSSKWMALSREGEGLAYMNDVFSADIIMPKVTPPEGQFKFVDRGLGKGEELGFLVKVKMEKLDQAKLPGKYKKTVNQGEFTIGPTETVVYTSHIDFTFKDADGFVLFKTKSEDDPGTQWPMEVWSGQETTLQGFGKDPVPSAVIARTKSIEMTLVLDKCDTCRP
jgi:hypothetical protein